ncbi:MAG: class I SAM-dependent methyltransferase [Nocardioidaceae bacterium]
MIEAGPEAVARRMAAESLAAADPTGWFERLYAAAGAGAAVVPWDRGHPHQLLVQWAKGRTPVGGGRTALVVGCGPGHDAEYVAGLGFDTLAFDVSASAVRAATERFPGSLVEYVVADLFNLPPRWRAAFDLVVESCTVQSLPVTWRAEAVAAVTDLVGPGGMLVVIASAPLSAEPTDGPPWPLTRTEVDSFATGGLRPVRIDDVRDPGEPGVHRWLAEFRRP